MAPKALVRIDQLEEDEVLAIVKHFRQFVDQNPQGARQVLMEHEGLTRCLALCQHRLGMLSSAGDETLADDSNEPLFNNLDPEQQELLQQVRSITPDVVRTLPPEQRAQIMELRKAMGLPPV